MSEPHKPGVCDAVDLEPTESDLGCSLLGSDITISWLVQSCTNPGAFANAARRLLRQCETGARHFAANNTSVSLANASELARAIRRYDLARKSAPERLAPGVGATAPLTE